MILILSFALIWCFYLDIGFHCGTLIIAGTQAFTCHWRGFQEAESELDHYLFGLGKAEGTDDVLPFVEVPADQLSFLVKG